MPYTQQPHRLRVNLHDGTRTEADTGQLVSIEAYDGPPRTAALNQYIARLVNRLIRAPAQQYWQATFTDEGAFAEGYYECRMYSGVDHDNGVVYQVFVIAIAYGPPWDLEWEAMWDITVSLRIH
jgi:hypothetical protein